MEVEYSYNLQLQLYLQLLQLYWLDDNKNKVEDTTFNNNIAQSGGAVQWGTLQGSFFTSIITAIFSKSTINQLDNFAISGLLEMRASLLTNNYAIQGGAVALFVPYALLSVWQNLGFVASIYTNFKAGMQFCEQ